MTLRNPQTEVDTRFSDPNAPATPWSQANGLLEAAKIYWLTTVRHDSRPNVTPLYAIWMDETFYFATGAGEQKAKNIAKNPHCTVITGCNTVEGVDVIIEGDVEPVTDEATLQTIAARFLSKYDCQYEARDGALYGDGGRAELYKIEPRKGLGFAKGGPFSQTRWRF